MTDFRAYCHCWTFSFFDIDYGRLDIILKAIYHILGIPLTLFSKQNINPLTFLKKTCFKEYFHILCNEERVVGGGWRHPHCTGWWSSLLHPARLLSAVDIDLLCEIWAADINYTIRDMHHMKLIIKIRI